MQPGPPGEGLDYTFATAEDDTELRRLLREIPMPGFLTVSMEREPSFFLAAGIEGEVHQTTVARLPGSPRLIGMASRSVLRAFVNGIPTRLGYLSQARLSPAYRGGKRILQRGFAMLHEKHLEDSVRLYVTSIIADNHVARRALAGGRPGIPPYTEQGTLSTLLIPLVRRRERPTPGRLVIRKGSAELIGPIAAFLQAEYARYQFAPFWTEADLMSSSRSRDLAPEDFLVATDGDRVVGCIAVWDQRAFKQTVVRRYALGLGRLVPSLNWAGGRLGLPRLPREGEVFAFANLSHFAVRGDDPAIGLWLVSAALAEARSRGLAFAALGLAERHPLCPRLKRAFLHLAYRAILYTVHWEDGAEAVRSLDGRVPHVEVALL